MRAKYLTLCLTVFAAPLVGASAQAQDRGAVFAGFSAGEDQSAYAGALLALPGSSLGKGLAVRASVSGGTYEYIGGPGMVEADFSGLEAGLVYQVSSPAGYLNLGAGAAYADTELSPSDPANEREGAHWDATVSIDGAHDIGTWRGGLYSSYGVSMHDYYVRADLTRPVTSMVRLGAEAIAQGDKMYDRQRYGLVVGFAPMPSWELRLSGGIGRRANDDKGGYGALSFVPNLLTSSQVPRPVKFLRPLMLASASTLALLATPALAQAQTPSDLAADIRRLQAQLSIQSEQLATQARLLADQQATLDTQRLELSRLGRVTDQALAETVGMGPADADAPIQLAQASPIVGVSPPEGNTSEPKVEVASIPEGMGVLTGKGRFVLEPSVDYTHGSSNRLVFRGIEIVTGVQIGVIEASDADRNAASGAVALRYGLTNRLEIEARAPFVYRADRITTLVQMEEAATRTFNLKGHDIGDVEVAARYQLNSGRNGGPILIAGLRAKSDTGTSPFEIERDEFGIANELATGSGFGASSRP